MAFSKYALCIDCHHGYTREHGPQRRCSTCQAAHEQAMAAVIARLGPQVDTEVVERAVRAVVNRMHSDSA